MCGIIGIWSANKNGQQNFNKLDDVLNLLAHRGPDFQQTKIKPEIALGHCRLSIIDLSEEANQPFVDETGNYSLIFNGEIYNYLSIKKELEKEHISFKTHSDTEVLLKLLIQDGVKGLQKLNGFFSFVFYDEKKNYVLAARDRIGIKPLLYSVNDDQIIFCSELKPILALREKNEIDVKGLNDLFTYTYIPADKTIVKDIQKLLPGQFAEIENGKLKVEQYYEIKSTEKFAGDYTEAQLQLRNLLDDSVGLRLIADVPVGSFLSGGVDSSIIALLAKKRKSDLNTFSIGFKNKKYDESNYAELVAKHIQSNHQTIILDKTDFENNLTSFLNCLDEPFADSSAFAVFLLSMHTAKKVKVALSGDGADELFAGYQKHLAEFKINSHSKGYSNFISAFAGVLAKGDDARDNKWSNFKRKLRKYADGIDMNANERYFHWCSWISKSDRENLLKQNSFNAFNLLNIKGLQDALIADQKLVLPNDMLKKVDITSMAHALEVRVPFLDHRIVEFANSLPLNFKIDKSITKKILRDTFKNELPQEIFTRSKKGFEIPLIEWLKTPLNDMFEMPLFSKAFIEEQNLFNWNFIQSLKSDLNQNKIGERIYVLWTLVVFQYWYFKNIHK